MKNIKIFKLPFLLIRLPGIALLILITSCATFASPDEETAMRVTELINAGNSSELKAMSADTILFDAEILHGPILTGSLWEGLTASGFRMDNAAVVERKAPEASDIKLFGGGPEVSAFFSRYITDDSVLFRIASDGDSIILILGPAEKGTAEIIAFGGPF